MGLSVCPLSMGLRGNTLKVTLLLPGVRHPYLALLGFSPPTSGDSLPTDFHRLKTSALQGPVAPSLSQPLSGRSCSSPTWPSCLPVRRGDSDWLSVLGHHQVHTAPSALGPRSLAPSPGGVAPAALVRRRPLPHLCHHIS